MSIMQTAGDVHRSSYRPQLRGNGNEYVIELEVSDFARDELSIETLGPLVTVRGDHLEMSEVQRPFRLDECLEESFRLPDDADPGRLRAFYRHGSLEIHAPKLRLKRRPVSVESESPSFIHAEATPC